MTKVLGIGNALVDLLIRLQNDDLLTELNLPKGSMTLVDEVTKDKISQLSSALKKEMASGGSAANTIHGLARLGIDTAFIGKIGQDEIGSFFMNDLLKSGIEPLLHQSGSASGLASAMISPDGERTFGTYLGAAVELSAKDLKPEQFTGFSILHVEGYLVQNHELLQCIMEYASKAGLLISLDLASYNVVEANLDFLKKISKKYVDLIFANEEEAKSFTGKEPSAALDELALISKIAVVKIGKKGSLVKSGDFVFEIKPEPSKAIDTTGAGDLYASGFIYGIIKGLPLDKAGTIGTLLASAVIENVGAKIPESEWIELVDKIKTLSSV